MTTPDQIASIVDYDEISCDLVWNDKAGHHRPAGSSATMRDREGRVLVRGHDAEPIVFYLLSGVWTEVVRRDMNRGLTLDNLEVVGVTMVPDGYLAWVVIDDARHEIGVYSTLMAALNARGLVLG